MLEKIKTFIFGRELYTKDTKKILGFHRVLQTLNIVGLFVSILVAIIIMFDVEDFGIFISILLGSILSFAVTKIILNVIFGGLYDIRALRMNSEKSSEAKITEDTNNGKQ